FINSYRMPSLFSQRMLRAVVEVTAAANALPTPGQDYNYYSSFPLFKEVMKAESTNIMKMMSRLVAHHIGNKNFFQNEGTDFEEKVDQLTEINDVLLERAGIELDVASGVKRDSDIQLTTVTKKIDTIWNQKNERLKRESSVTLLTAANVTRPQLSFPDKIDNSNSPFVPIIKDKPNALKPLAILVETIDGEETYSHPYEFEIEKFSPTDEQMRPSPRETKPLGETPLELVSTPGALKKVLEELKQHRQIAIDLEHHSFRSFMGFTCLVQVSTWDKDYIIDPLELRGHLHVLNEVTTDPKIVKVLHGSHSDVQWLQRDFGVYIVNLFDTGIAAKLLNYERLSLSYLLKKFEQVESDKRFQLVDWRIRPLPKEMIEYARTDTHYLLSICEKLKEELNNASNEAGNLMKAVWQRSSLLCLKRYEKPILTEESHRNLLKTANKRFNDKQLYALKHIFAWRDRLARELDESTGYVLPNHMLLNICELLPREMQGIVSCCNPCPPLVKQQLNELHQMVLKAREVQLSNPLLDAPKIDIPLPALHVMDFDNMLHVIHDLNIAHEHDEVRLPTLIDENGELLKDSRRAACEFSVPRMARSSLLPQIDRMKEGGASRMIFKSSTGGVLRVITPYERYTRERERMEKEGESLSKLLEEAKREAELKEVDGEDMESSKKEERGEVSNEVSADDAKALESNEPEIIRGNSKKRKRPQPSIPLLGGHETSYGETNTEKLEKNSRKSVPEDFDYNQAISQQNAPQQDSQRNRRGRGNNRGRGGRANNRGATGGGRGRGDFHGNSSKRKQFDDLEDLQDAEGTGSQPRRGSNKKARFRGNKSFTVRGSGRGGSFRGRQ
ncbi:exosome component 10, partial [Galendromus occidentalis]|uniref:Exosome complex component 10 homolog n=1 Tax=Galendromus occidentalis TaxID=34638 RepID=A0AAJ7SH08_9ACAR